VNNEPTLPTTELPELLNQSIEVSENVNAYTDVLTYIAEQQTLTNNILLFIVGTVSALLVCYILYRFIRKFI
jgi:hypothetical protein